MTATFHDEPLLPTVYVAPHNCPYYNIYSDNLKQGISVTCLLKLRP